MNYIINKLKYIDLLNTDLIIYIINIIYIYIAILIPYDCFKYV